MNEFLKKIKLTDNFKTELYISKSDFVKSFKNQIEPSDFGMFSDVSDMFSSSKKEYKGTIDNRGFIIKRKRRFFDSKTNSAKAYGTFKDNSERLIIDSQIKGFNKGMYFFYGFLIVFYIIFISGFTFVDFKDGPEFFILPFIIIHAGFMIGIPYFMMRRSVSRMKYDLEREFHYLSK